MKKNQIINTITIGATMTTTALSAQTDNTEKKDLPNIVYILCDDLGYGDVQCLNPKRGKIPTPNIDKLATQGMTFTDAHSGSSVCTPTRYGILTGRYAWRTRLQNGVLGGDKAHSPLIAKNRLTVPALLKKAGYNTACLGKWHLGFKYVDAEGKAIKAKKVKGNEGGGAGVPIGAIVPDGPVSRGFDYYLGFHHSRTMKTVVENDKVIKEMPSMRMLGMLGDKASQYIAEEAKKKEPFFLYLPLNSPHGPIVPSEKWQGKSGIGEYGDFVMETDSVIGQVMEALNINGVADNTLLVFTSDNGCSYPCAKVGQLEKIHGHFPSAHLRGYKSDIWDGGHRVPLFVRWPGKIKPGSQTDELICLTSLMATCAEITGQKLPENAGEDSISILPILLGKEGTLSHDAVVHHSISGKFSIRKGKWKLEFCPGSGGWTVNDKEAKKQGLPEIQLYDMDADVSEKINVFDKHPEVIKELTEVLKQLVDNGRTTPGKTQKNDVKIDIFKK